MRYSLTSIASIIGVFLSLFFLLLGIFAIEKLAFLIDISIRFQVDFTRFFKLYLSILPDIADYIIPIAILVAVYFVLLRKREARELLVLSGVGVNVGHIVRMVLVPAMFAAILCIIVSGFLKPAAKHAFRYQYRAAIADLAVKGLPGGRFFRQDDKVLFVASSPGDSSKKMKFFSFRNKKLNQIFFSDCARLQVTDGIVLSNICKGQAYIFNHPGLKAITGENIQPQDRDCRICANENGRLNIGRLHMANSTFSLEMKSVFEIIKNQRRKELNIFALLQQKDGVFISRSNAAFAGAVIFLAFSCIFAVAIAVIAVALTNSRTRLFALAVAIGVEMVIVVIMVSGVIFTPAATLPINFAALIAGCLILGVSSVPAAAVIFHKKLIVPALVRS